MEATIESFVWGEQDATGDIYYTCSLKEYKNKDKESYRYYSYGKAYSKGYKATGY